MIIHQLNTAFSAKDIEDSEDEKNNANNEEKKDAITEAHWKRGPLADEVIEDKYFKLLRILVGRNQESKTIDLLKRKCEEYYNEGTKDKKFSTLFSTYMMNCPRPHVQKSARSIIA